MFDLEEQREQKALEVKGHFGSVSLSDLSDTVIFSPTPMAIISFSYSVHSLSLPRCHAKPDECLLC